MADFFNQSPAPLPTANKTDTAAHPEIPADKQVPATEINQLITANAATHARIRGTAETDGSSFYGLGDNTGVGLPSGVPSLIRREGANLFFYPPGAGANDGVQLNLSALVDLANMVALSQALFEDDGNGTLSIYPSGSTKAAATGVSGRQVLIQGEGGGISNGFGSGAVGGYATVQAGTGGASSGTTQGGDGGVLTLKGGTGGDSDSSGITPGAGGALALRGGASGDQNGALFGAVGGHLFLDGGQGTGGQPNGDVIVGGGGGITPTFVLGGTTVIKWNAANQQTTVGAAGAADPLPGSPAMWLVLKDKDGNEVAVPAWPKA